MNKNNLLSESSKHTLHDMIKQYEVTEREIDNRGERETCQNCRTCFSSDDDYVTLCSKCRYELLGI